MRYKNNPFNIRWNRNNNWRGQELFHENGFCEFSSLYFGVRAYFVIMRNYRRQGYCTPEQIISRYSPNSENNTLAYIQYVCKLDFKMDEWLSVDDYLLFSLRMFSFEQGREATSDEFATICSCFDVFQSKL